MEKMSELRMRWKSVSEQSNEALHIEMGKVRDLIERGSILSNRLKETRDSISAGAEQIGQKKPKTDMLGKLSDFGKSKHGVLLEKRSAQAIDRFAQDLMEYMPMEDRALEIGIERKKKSVEMSKRLARPRTQFQLRQQAVNVDKGIQRIDLVCRQLTQRMKEIQNELDRREAKQPFEEMRSKVVEMVEKAKAN